MCGDNFKTKKKHKRVIGGPPHVRGQRDLQGLWARRVRGTSACAGTTATVTAVTDSASGDLRMCGGQRLCRRLHKV